MSITILTTQADLNIGTVLSGDGSDISTKLLAAVALAADERRRLVIPKPETEWLVSQAIPITAQGMAVLMHEDAVVRQSVQNVPVFDIDRVNDVSIDGGNLQWTGARTYLAGSAFRGSEAYIYGSAVWSSGARTRIRNVRASGFTCGVFLNNWNGSALSGYVADQSIENLIVDDVDFGVLAVGQDRPIIRGLRGSYALQSGSPNPPHLIYFSGVYDSRDINIDDCAAVDGTESYAYQFKDVVGGAVGKLVARNCAGVLSLRDVQNLTFGQIVSTADLGDASENGSIYFQGAGESDVVIRQAFVDMAAEKRVLRMDGTDCVVGQLQAKTIRSTVSDAYDVTVQGTRSRIEDLSIFNSGAGGCRAVGVLGGSDHYLRIRELTNTKYGVEVQSGRTNTTVDIDPKRISFASGVGALSRVVRIAESTASIRSREQTSSRTVAAGVLSNTVFEPSRYSHITLQVNDTTAFTIGAPIEAFTGATLTFEIFDNSAGMGAITWNAAYVFRTAWANPATTARKFITFRYDGTNWQEVSRSG